MKYILDQLSSKKNKTSIFIKSLFLIWGCQIIGTNNYAQDATVPMNPTASSINYNSSSNTNFFDGSETYVYPIGSISDGALTHQVSVSNNMSGIRVGTLASDIGLGWNVNAGGKITRSIRGISDGDNKTGEGWWSRSAQGLGLPSAKKMAKGEEDGAPDMYHVNAGNLNFTFFYDDNNVVHTIPKSNIKVTKLHSTTLYEDEAKGFKIVDGVGNKYFFGHDGVNENIEFVETYSLGSDLIGMCGEDKMDAMVGWFLYRITSPDERDKINFHYSSSGYEYYSLAEQNKYIKHSGEDDHKFHGNDDYYGDKVFSLFVTKTCQLDKIETSFEKFVFRYGNLRQDLSQDGVYWTQCGEDNPHDLESRELDAIEYSDNSGNVCISHEFELEYFVDNSPPPFNWIYLNWTKKRLCLTSITKKVCNSGVDDLKTSFSYYGGSFFPNCLSTAIDHWGFCNSAWDNPMELIPETTYGSFTYGSADREPDLVGSQLGILKRVTFPTGGFIDFELEQNEALICESGNCNNQLVGGLRVKKKTTSDGINAANDIIENFEYKKFSNPNESSGQLHFGLPEYVTGLSVGAYFYFKPDFPLQNYFGSHINYCEVAKNQPGLGRTEYTFENLTTLPSSSFPKPPAQYTNEIGFLTNQETFDESNPNSLSNTTHARKNDALDNIITARTAAKRVIGITGGTATYYTLTDYEIYTGVQRTESQTHTQDGFERTHTFGYNAIDKVFLPTWQETVNSDGKVHRTEFTYAETAPIWGSPEAQQLFSLRNMKDVLWKTIRKVDGQTIDGTATEYEEFGSNPAMVKPYKFYRAERGWDDSGNIYPLLSESWVLQKTIVDYNDKGRVKKTSTPGFSQHTNYAYYSDNKRLQSISYNGKTTTYDYYGNSNILEWKEGPDNLREVYFYDQLGRLEKTLDECSGIFTEHDYVFGNGSGPDDYIETTHNFTANTTSHPNCPITTLVQRNYVDGLGRQIQTVLLGQHPDGTSNVVHSSSFDQYGRSDKSFLPFTSSNSGAFISPSNSWGFSQKNYENSPLSRVENVNPPGSLTGSFMSYGTNTAADNVKKIGNSNPYLPNLLTKVTTANGDGDKAILFKDKIGRLILQREESADGSEQKDTYYQYDPKGRLVCVFPAVPAEIDGTTIPSISEDLLFKYTYYPDDKEKTVKLPDSEFQEYIYNVRGQLTASQNGNLRSEGKWMIYNYDSDDRISASFLLTGSVPPNETFYNFDVTNNDVEQLTETLYGSSGISTHKPLIEKTRILDTDFWLIHENHYDSCGKLEYSEFNNHLEPNNQNGTSLSSRIDFIYDQTNSVIETHLKQVDNGITYNFKQRDIKDHTGRIIGHEINWNDTGWKLQSETAYNEREEVIQKRLGHAGSNWLQTVDYTYKDWGALHTINNGANLGNLSNTSACGNLPSTGNNADLFSLKLHYDSSPYSNPQYDGNISYLEYGVMGRAKQYQGFFYDYMNRLTDMVQSGFSTSYTYDDRGNITTTTREGLQVGENGCYSANLIDNLTYTYKPGSNQLQSVSDAVDPCPESHLISGNVTTSGNYSTQYELFSNGSINPSNATTFTAGDMVRLDAGFEADGSLNGGSFIASNDPCTNGQNQIIEQSTTPGSGFIEKGGQYIYDDSGNMTYDPNRQVTYKYNHLNLVKEIEWNDGRHLYMSYDAKGNLLSRMTEPDLDPMPPVISRDLRDYLGPIEIFNGIVESVYHDSGRLTFESGTQATREEFALTDHLGNTRILFSDLNGNGTIDLTQDPATTEILQENHYYPFGMRMSGPWLEDIHATENYQYNGMEYVDDFGLGLNMTTYRNLDPTLGLWTSVDPKAELGYAMSPYNSMQNNPISYSDPEGDWIHIAVGAVVGGTVNLVDQAIKGNVTSIGEGLAYFGTGAAAGAAVSVGQVGAARAITVVGNKSIQIATGKFSLSDLESPGDYASLAFDIGTDLLSPGLTSALSKPITKNLTARALAKAIDDAVVSGGTDIIKHTLSKEAVEQLTKDAVEYQFAATFTDDFVITATKTASLTNAQLIHKSAAIAEKAIGGTGRFAGTAKHTYANNLLKRYQSIYGDKGFKFNSYFNNNATLGSGNRGFLDVVNHKTKTIYDFKFGSATWRSGQFEKYSRNFPGYDIFKITP